MNLFFVCVFVTLVPASMMTMITCLAVGLSLGPSRISVRLPIFLIGSAIFAGVICLFESNSECWPLGIATVVLGLLALGMRDRFIAMIAIGCGLPLVLFTAMQVISGGFQTRSFTATMLASGFLALMFSTLRFAGYRLTRLANPVSATDLHLATGTPLHQWIAELDRSDALPGNYAETMSRLSDRGLTNHWQKIITKSYERSRGRMPIERSSDGRPVFVAPDRLASFFGWSFGQLRHRFSVWQMMVWSFCAATVFGLGRQLPPLNLPSEAVAIAVPMAAAITIIALACMHGILSPRLGRASAKHHILIVAVTILVFPKVVGLAPGDPRFFILMAWLITSMTLWFALACMAAREQGLSLVRMEAQQSTAPRTAGTRNDGKNGEMTNFRDLPKAPVSHIIITVPAKEIEAETPTPYR
ncbi:hypothetical protein [Rubripirellula reticaptiva]|uniref:Uncharacterized protein n=1 Tax=Rubripirellula reticaptiva TaxID=2528013 RepID=A0A5C6EK45_9BACT|nr:hypothetical protein [Rubripirellula reticaptiva]TWU48477.1 hypothetical protein Poly59_53250 [Rubripirellula reticaptiva]